MGSKATYRDVISFSPVLNPTQEFRTNGDGSLGANEDNVKQVDINKDSSRFASSILSNSILDTLVLLM